MYPLLTINKQKIIANTKEIVTRAALKGINITAVTKVTGGNAEIAQALLDGGVTALGDSRIINLKKLAHLPCEKWLIRIPMPSEVNQTVAYSNLSLNSEIKTIRLLNEAAKTMGRTHSILYMLDLGDLREGLFIGDGQPAAPEIEALISDSWQKLDENLREIKTMEHIRLRGIGTNATCVGATIPTPDSFTAFFKVKKMLEEKYEIPCEIISGGNSSAYYLIENDTFPEQINNLRLGEVILFGRESAYFKCYDYLHQDAFILDVEIVELQDKPTFPIGEIGKNAFEEIPDFEDKGIRRRAICGLGRQDTDTDHLFPLDAGITIEGSSSDHLVIDVTDANTTYEVGDIISLRCDYVGALHAATSAYVDKIVIS
ncbi:alanine/ornithine racemase family PLP-dependent enzyme [Acetobacterium fimetarium]|uniref:Alanine/ornithine racemase family PLP-dependent enzyme n=1 Tax=Acetobacterium fimetarium TaxID=52691 RepID=A0ABR6WWX3_9FIRM|nr:alanine/ornithine racemase family PLP-dependent enzyme [Acetobacterium fimetarium]MBC3804943.1 alanine/ornithine racemase family PLP-dependent enzyme [Acetobacterium fimetarium]